MRFPIRLIVDYAMKNPTDVDRAYQIFFGSLPFSQLKTEWEDLFVEWLVFDFKRSGKPTFVVEYVLKNPGRLSDVALSQLKQIASTHFYSQFEVLEIRKGEWLRVIDLFSGKFYRIYDKKGSESIASPGVVPARAACVNNRWYWVGANSVYFPVTYTKRAKILMKKLAKKDFSPKDTVELLRRQDE